MVDYISYHGLFAFSDETFEEFTTILRKPKFDKYVSQAKRERFTEKTHTAYIFFDIYHTLNICKDTKDNKFLDIAIASYADCLITGDDDLLSLEYIGNTAPTSICRRLLLEIVRYYFYGVIVSLFQSGEKFSFSPHKKGGK